MIRIQSGLLKGRSLPTPDPKIVRPTTQKVRAAVLNMLQSDLQGAVFWDLFSGSGAVGLEAYSRGAGHALFLEKDPAVAAALRSWTAREIPEHRGNMTCLCGDALAFLENPPSLPLPDIVFLDPPYRYPDWSRLLNLLCRGDIVIGNSLIVVEYHRKDPLPWGTLLDWGCQVFSHHSYGESGVSLLRPTSR